ncbi:MAG: glycosyltransferase family 4 protein [Candidatus Bathyarchaeota archaeon]
MKVGILHNIISVHGGAGRFALTLIRLLKEHGHEVVLATFDKPDWRRIENNLGYPPIIPDECIWVFGGRLPIFGLYQRLFGGVMLSKKLGEKCDLTINTHSDYLFSNTDIIYVHGIQDFKTWTKHSPLHKKVYYFPYRILNLRGFRDRGQTIIANSTYVAKKLSTTYGKVSSVIHPPIDVKRYNKLLSKDKEDLVLTIGRASWEKNLEVLPEIISHTPEHISFALVTSTNIAKNKILDRLRLHENERFKIYANTSQDIKDGLIRKAKVYLHTSPYETFGISIAECISAGLFPVMVNGGGHVETFNSFGSIYDSLEEAGKMIEQSVKNWNYDQAKLISSRMDRFSEQRFAREMLNLIK